VKTSCGPSSLHARNAMRANRSESGLERRFRQALWAKGLRGFRRRIELPGHPDVVFPSVRLAVFVHGCFWHRCPICRPQTVVANGAFWRAKFARNVARDQEVVDALGAAGWRVRVIWEHQLRSDLAGCVVDLARLIEGLGGELPGDGTAHPHTGPQLADAGDHDRGSGSG
jgi:DNA mismatch endonuclease (patch repair protein)